MRAIDADALIDDLKHDVVIDQDSLDYEELTDSNRENIQFDKDCKQNAIDLLKNAPTIEPERKGKWLKSYADHEAFGVRPFFRYCSECNEATVHAYNYCPNCGCKMEVAE